jgi:hypothetical protein
MKLQIEYNPSVPSINEDEFLAVILSAVGILVIVAGIYGTWWALSSVLNYIPEVIMLSILGLLGWGFRRRILRAVELLSNSTASAIPIAVRGSIDTSRVSELKTIQADPIRHYTTRDELRFTICIYTYFLFERI